MCLNFKCTVYTINYSINYIFIILILLKIKDSLKVEHSVLNYSDNQTLL